LAVKASVVQVSGRGTNVDFAIDDASRFSQVTSGLREYLVENRGLWSKGKISVNVGQRMHSREELSQIKQIIEKESGLTVTRFWCSPEILEQGGDSKGGIEPPPFSLSRLFQASTEIPDPAVAEPAPASSSNDAPLAYDPPPLPYLERQDTALFVKSTCRSGESVHYAGDVVILGDVNPGAEIMAEGDIAVFGTLRGTAHAGTGGNSKAMIIATNLVAPRIQIGPFSAFAPSPEQLRRMTSPGPKVAYVRRRSIYVTTFAGRFARYSKGVPYEG
jgi:septum site-determining protein MinC